mmetsp:Transcript_1184/g.3084  ORF Transcript_1184/g.3084 Transcript_1184/m.3084 type:complete len:89 (+) Transcript_1184:84-350(+)
MADDGTAPPPPRPPPPPGQPSYQQIWLIREWLARIFGTALLVGSTVLILGCCFTQPGCYVYDHYIDKRKAVADDDEEDPILPGSTTKA